MISDPSIREQGYIYFLSEAPELLQTIEQELFNLSENYSTATVHNLMRATHTIKGGAANVGLEVINKISHSLEDVFKALYSPDVEIDGDLLSLLFQAYECLQLPLTAELNNTNINAEEVLQRATTVFAQLQEKLGDAFGAEAYIPTSAELGFDIVQSVFEMGVGQRIDALSEAIESNQSSSELADLLRSQAEVFVGLAESLNLPGFGEIAQNISAALDTSPSHISHIASTALTDLKNARDAVLAGDRARGGEPSPTLLQLASGNLDTNVTANKVTNSEEDDTYIPILNDSSSRLTASSLRYEIEELYKFLIQPDIQRKEPLKPTVAKFYLKVIRYIFGWFNHELDIPEHKLALELIVPKRQIEDVISYVENWLSEFFYYLQDSDETQGLSLYRQGVILTIVLAVAKFQCSIDQKACDSSVIPSLQDKISELAQEYRNYPPVSPAEKNWLEKPKLQKLLEIKDISQAQPVESSVPNLVETIWGEEVIPTFELQDNSSLVARSEIENDDSVAELLTVIQKHVPSIVETEKDVDTVIEQHTDNSINQKLSEKEKPSTQKNTRLPSYVRVDVEGLGRLNYLAGELLIYIKRRSLLDENLQEIIGQLSEQLSRHQTTLNELRDLPLRLQNFAKERIKNVASVDFDSLEMDEYTDFQLTLHSALEETLQLQETTESLDLILRQSSQIHEKKQRLVLNIIENLVDARMLPLGNILLRFPQMVQNLGNVYGKLVELKLTGTQVLVDKAIAEKLYDPLLQLVRNAFDHGIEQPQARRDRGKQESGTIEICAYHQGSQTIIEVRDDGQGLNLEKIRAKAVELRLISSHDEFYKLTEDEILDFLFSPGFSTAGKVSELSGRGMGLDIVRSQLQALNGSITVQSVPNQGTIFILKIPFSMTTDQLMLVQAGGAVYALLLDSIEKILIPSESQVKEFEGKKALHWSAGKEERMVSLRRLSDLMHYNGSLPNNSTAHHQLLNHESIQSSNPVLLVRRDRELLGLEVDQIIGEQELVIRPLGNSIAPPKYVYGCSSLANGTLILVIDGALLLESNDVQYSQATLEPRKLPGAIAANKKPLPMLSSVKESTPLLSASVTPSTAPTAPTKLKDTPPKPPKVVLVVDDAISLRQTLSLTLQKYGYQVIQAENGVEALEQLQRHPDIKLVVSDLEMPRMNGFELLTNIRQKTDVTKLPVIILTSRSADKHRKLAQALGATAYLTKPYLEHEFISTVEGLVHNHTEQLVLQKQ